MDYEHMTTAALISVWDEASKDLRPEGNWMFHDSAHRTIAKVTRELESRGFFDRPTVGRPADLRVTTNIEID